MIMRAALDEECEELDQQISLPMEMEEEKSLAMEP